MGKASPVICDDEDVYILDKCEAEFLLNARRLFDFGFGARFDDVVVRKMKYSVGLLLHTAEVVQYDDSVIENFFDAVEKRGVDFLYAIPTGYRHDKNNEESMEVCDYQPPLLGKIRARFEWFSKIRGGQIGIYSRSVYFFSRCLNFSFLDVDGQYSLIMGSCEFVDEVVGKDSWNVLDGRNGIVKHVELRLREARIAYGYE